MSTMFKSLILSIALLIATVVSIIPAVLFHFMMMYIVIGEENWEVWQGWSNLATICIMIASCYFLTRPGTFIYKLLSYLADFR